MGALLSSLQMGFRTLAIEKRSNDVWTTLGAVKTEFSKFGDLLEKAKTGKEYSFFAVFGRTERICSVFLTLFGGYHPTPDERFWLPKLSGHRRSARRVG